MSSGVPAKVIATSFALAAFAIAIIAGLAAGNPSPRVLLSAILSMALCQVLGMVVGSIGERIVREHIESYRAARPVHGAAAQIPHTSPASAPTGNIP